MVGLIGILKVEEGNINISELLMRMCKVLRHEKWLKINHFIEENIGLGRVSLGIVNPEPQPLFNEDKSLLIMMDGEIFDYLKVKNELINKGHTFLANTDAEFILHCYEEYGLDMVNFLNGSYLIALWDKKKNKLILINDRFGSRPLFYAFNNGSFLFSPEVKSILEDKTFKRIVNDAAVFDFFLRGHLLGDITFFHGIKSLPPASILEIEERNVKLKRYWNFNFNENYSDYPEEYYIEELEKLILQAVQRQSNKNKELCVSLSGGLDSRTIAAALHKNNPNFKFSTFTYGKDSYCDDARFAYAVSRKLGVPHYFFKTSPDLALYAEKIVYITDGMVPCYNLHAITVFGFIRQYCKIIMAGALMDAMFSILHPPFYRKSRKYAIHRIYNDFTETSFDHNMIRKLFAKDFYSKYKESSWKAFKEIMRENKCNLSSNVFSHYVITQRTRHLILKNLALTRNYNERRTPFFDNDLIEFFLNVPPKLRFNAYLYSKTLRKLSPELARINWQRTGYSICANMFQVFLYRAGRKIFKIFSKLIRKISFYRINLYNPRKELHNYDKWIRKNKKVRDFFLNILLDKKTLSRKYFNPNFIKKLVMLHMTGKKNYSNQLILLLTFELWFRQFVDNKADN